MAITQLDITQLRNLKQVSIKPTEGFNFVFGPNGSGKTSLIEAIYCLGRAKSFRSHKLDTLIATDADQFTVVGQVQDQQHKYTIGLKRQARDSRIRLNGQPVHKATQLIDALPIALIEPGLHRLIDEGPEFRRKFLDWGLFHVEPQFSNVWTSYRRALSQRNAAIRAGWAKNSVMHWDNVLSHAAKQIDLYRRAYLANLEDYITDTVKQFTGLEAISIQYHQGWREEVDYAEYLQQQFDSDLARGFTQFGPHRADLRFKVGNSNARDLLSRGQQKVFVASLILAQCRQLTDTHTTPVILIDDLPSELDENKRSSLLSLLASTGSQVFITATDPMLFDHDIVSSGSVFHVEQGVVKPVV
jgi:DNA replication and repair protein RecF